MMMLYRIDVYQPNTTYPYDKIYVKPQNINYWLTGNNVENEDFWTVNNLMVSPQKWAKLFSVP